MTVKRLIEILNDYGEDDEVIVLSESGKELSLDFIIACAVREKVVLSGCKIDRSCRICIGEKQ